MHKILDNENTKKRCSWVNLNNKDYVKYHDEEWGVPVHDDRLLFETLSLECFVSGLSWECVLNKRKAFKVAFDNFDALKVSKYDEKKIKELVENKLIIRHAGKIKATINNAQVFLDVAKEYKSFNNYIWHFTNGKTIVANGIETTSSLSDAISKDLKKRGMKFVGSTTVYSFLAAIGVINAHQKDCFLKLEGFAVTKTKKSILKDKK
ncbi:MAG: DNA-3-methyladenine glycosylase I [Bdellovibrionota bacterium]|jgi:DNA-3-methyladenine glycosylase I